jgi:hypothetical protein
VGHEDLLVGEDLDISTEPGGPHLSQDLCHQRPCRVHLDVADRASAFALEATVLRKFRPAAPPTVAPADLPQGGATECWDALGGYPDLAELARA